MDLHDITRDWIGEILEAARKHQPLPTHPRLDCLAAYSQNEYEQALIDLLCTHITKELFRYRMKLGVPPLENRSLEGHRKAIEQDARRNDPRLIMWTFMYYRYVFPDMRVKEVSGIAKYSGGNHRVKIKQGHETLARFIHDRESKAHANLRLHQFVDTLGEAEYSEYIGMEKSLDRLVDHVRDPEGPRWISIEGLGGIGKTALARRVTEELVKQDETLSIFWLSARQQRFDPVDGTLVVPDAALTAEDLVDQLWQIAMLQADPTLTLTQKIDRLAVWSSHLHTVIVLDNLETVEDVAAMAYFSPLAATARFLITSRESLAQLSYVMVHQVMQLSKDDSAALLLREYHERKTAFLKKNNPGSSALSKSPSIPLKDKHFEQIQRTVGGFPLALKLVAAQIFTMPIDDCLAGLRQITPQTRSEEMFTYIYRQTWMLLNSDTQNFLLTIQDTLPDEGVPLEWLARLSQSIPLSSEQFDAVLQQLNYYSLLELTPKDQQYRLHRLTITFLQNEFRSNNTQG